VTAKSDQARLGELAYALRVLHQRLLAATQQEFEKLHGRVENPGALLQLAVHDPLFAWLRPLSQQLAALDELAATDDLDAVAEVEARAAVITLLEGASEFHATYLVYLQADPDVVMAHAAVRRLLRPRGGDPNR
jgi:hypothetical protein